MHISKYAKYGHQQEGWLYTYYNDSLKFSMDFFGIHTFDSTIIKKEINSKENRKLLFNLNLKIKVRFLFQYKSTSKGNGTDCICYTGKIKNLTIDSSRFLFSTTTNGDPFFYSKENIKTVGKDYMVGGITLENKIFIFINSQTQIDKLQTGASSMYQNTIDELSSIKNSSTYYQFVTGRKNTEELINQVGSGSTEYINDRNKLLAIPLDTIEKYSLEHAYFQALITKVSFFDNINEIQKFNRKYKNYIRKNETITNKKDSIIVYADALTNVTNISKTQKILMINESHYDYRHRLFIYLLLDSLYKIGYRNLCLEDRVTDTITNSIYPCQRDGIYISEPFMGSLVRKYPLYQPHHFLLINAS